MGSFNRTFITDDKRCMNCPICGDTQTVFTRIGGSAEASRNALRLKMIEHLKASHDGTRMGRKFLDKFGANFIAGDPNMGAPKVDPADLERTIRRIVAESMKGTTVDESMVRDAVRKELKLVAQANTLTIIHASDKVSTIKNHHAMLREVIRTANAGFKNILLVGPAGTGKTTLVMQMAKELRRAFGFISFTSGITEGSLVGRLNSLGKYIGSQLADMFEKPGVFLLDEIDRADPNVLLILNAALEQGILALPDGRTLKRHADLTFVGAGNTWGTGADWQYVGANQLDASTLSRFTGAVIEVGYDEKLERSLTTESWYTIFMAVRVNCSTNKIRRVMGTRELLAGEKLLKAGYTPQETWSRLTAGWSADERRKAGVPN